MFDKKPGLNFFCDREHACLFALLNVRALFALNSQRKCVPERFCQSNLQTHSSDDRSSEQPGKSRTVNHQRSKQQPCMLQQSIILISNRSCYRYLHNDNAQNNKLSIHSKYTVNTHHNQSEANSKRVKREAVCVVAFLCFLVNLVPPPRCVVFCIASERPPLRPG